MDIIIIVLGIVLVIVGVLGCILPVIPGPPLAWLALLLLKLSGNSTISVTNLVVWGGVVLLVTILDYVVPIWGTKRFGGSKFGTWGSTVGLIAGLFFAPWGIVLGPFVGAFAGELVGGMPYNKALKAGFGAFVGFLTGVLLKLVVSVWIAVIFVQDSFNLIKAFF